MSQYSYIRVRWLHSSSDDPADLWSELDADREEVRKVEIWSDGRVGYASDAGEISGTRLGKVPVPPLNEINLDPQFQAKAITKADFETCWLDAIGKD
ncbi:DUF6881 domain-containing protein [Rhizobium sp. BK650]|uniref:DUF6881 domain-containing protein n=1 Tax=Rhizobium sp. BK650 TaxID=2586990 RepID=UPI00391832EC